MIRYGIYGLAAIVAVQVAAQVPNKIYAQHLLEKTAAANPDLKGLAMHVTPPGGADNIVIASTMGKTGDKSKETDLAAMKSAEIRTEGDRLDVELPLQDVSGRAIGALEVVFANKTGGDRVEFEKRAERIRDALRRRISHVKNLLEPAQFDPAVPTDTYAQQLVDRTLDANPDVIILALHATPPKGTKNVIVGSNIGRIGKEANSDDMDVVNTGVPKLELNEPGDRFEVEQRLLDVSGVTLGAVGVVFPYKQGDDKSLLKTKADKISDDLKRHILSAGNLLEPAPFDPTFPSNTYAQRLVDQTMAKHPELLILAIHATPPNSTQNVIMGSNIGRIGKKADEDDLRVIQTGVSNLEINSTGNRFEAELQLHDATGKPLGALGTVFAYKAGDDKDALRKQAETICSEIERQIFDNARLFAVQS